MSRSVPRLPSPLGVPSFSQEIIFSDVPDISLTSPLLIPAGGKKGHERNTSSIDSAIDPGGDAIPLLEQIHNGDKGVPSLGKYTRRQGSQHSPYPPWPWNTSYTNAEYPKQYQWTENGAGQYKVVDQSPTSPDFLRSPLTPSFTPDASGGTSKQHPFAKTFEPPNWSLLAIHAVLCGLAYPFIWIFVAFAQNKSLFWTRFLVGVGSGISGALLGWSLLGLARRVLEASAWATLIHQSHVPRGAGVRLKDLAAQCDGPCSAVTGLRLLWDRHHYPGANIQRRRGYDPRRWSAFVLLFLANVALAGVLPFLFGRIVDIEVRVMHQNDTYSEVAVWGDLSEEDIQRANGSDLQRAFNDSTLTWTLAPFSVHGGLPKVVSFMYRNDSVPVYFSEVIPSQLLPNGSGFGTFEMYTTVPSVHVNSSQPAGQGDPSQPVAQGDPIIGLEPGSLLRFPRWGIRIKCAKIPNGGANIVPSPLSKDNLTHLFTPRDTIRPLFSALNVTFPLELEKPLNVTFVAQANAHHPALNISQMALEANFSDNGVAHSMFSRPLGMVKDGTGFVTIENILVRLNSSYAPNGKFSVQTFDRNNQSTYIGYDAAVCVELYEPWVLEVYNSSVGLPVSVKIVGRRAGVRDVPNQGRINGTTLDAPSVKTGLNSTNLSPVYVAAHQNGVHQISKDNGRDKFYIPSPTLVSFTNGQGPYGYTELSAELYANARAMADAGNVLPYFAGSASTLAHSYVDKVVASASTRDAEVVILILTVFFMGLLSALFVPRLPLDVPRRGFDLYSWMSAFYARELVADGSSGISKNMDLEAMQKDLGELKFRYTV